MIPGVLEMIPWEVKMVVELSRSCLVELEFVLIGSKKSRGTSLLLL